MPTSQTDNYDYTTAGYDNYLTRKTPVKEQTVLDDNTSLNIEQITTPLDGVVKFMRQGLFADRPSKGQRKGAMYMATDTPELLLWDGIQWLTASLASL